jgi:crossover junction endodeoxyribonuclease RuvC
MVRILGLDPGSRITGYGVVDAGRQGVRYVASGCIRVGQGEMAPRLLQIHRHVTELVDAYGPVEIAVERVFMHRNPDSALKLGQARGAALCGACHGGAPVFEYAPRAVKQTVTGTGRAEKAQVAHMIKALLALEGRVSADAADALAIALCHAQHRDGAGLARRARSGR